MPTIGEGVIKIVSDTSGFGKGLQDTMAKIGPAATTGLAVVGAAAVGAGVALYKIGENFQEAYNTIRKTTGKTGGDMKGLEESFKNVAKQSGRSFDDIAKAIGQVSVRTGATGQDLENLTLDFLRFSKVTGIDVVDSVNKITRVMGDWDSEVGDASRAMDVLYRASTETGVGVDRLADSVVKFGSPMRALGFSFTETTAMLGKFEQEGVNTDLVMGSMRIALGKMAKAGEKDLPAALQRSIKAIQETGSSGDAAAKAIELFGARAGPDMAAAIREGRFEIDDLVKSLENSEGAVKDTAAETATFGGNMGKFKNQVAVALEPLATTIFTSINEGAAGVLEILREFLERIAPAIEKAADFAKELANYSDIIVPVVLAFGGLAVAIKGVMIAIGLIKGVILGVVTAVKIFQGAWLLLNMVFAASPIGAIITGVLLLIAGLVLLYLKFQPFRDLVDSVWQGLQKLADIIWGAVVGAFDAIVGAMSKVIDWVRANWVMLAAILLGPFTTVAFVIYKYWDEITDFFKAVPGKIGQALAALPKMLLNAFEEAVAYLIVGLYVVIKGLYLFWTQVVPNIIKALADLAPKLVATGKNAVTSFLGSLADLAGRLASWAAAAMVSMLTGLKNGLVSVISWALGVPGQIVNALISLGTKLLAFGGTAVGELKKGLERAIPALLQAAQRIPGEILGKLAALPGEMFNVGRRIIEQLIKGVESMINAVGDSIGRIAGKVRDKLPFSPAKEGPLSGRGNPFYSGQAISRLLAEGIDSRAGLVGSAMADLTAMATPPAMELATVGAGADGRGAAAGAAPSYTLNIYPQTLDEQGVLAAFHRLEMIGSLR